MIYIIFSILIFSFGCDKKKYDDFSPTYPTSNCEIEDITGVCCSINDMDCSNICFGNAERDQCDICNGDGTQCILDECNDSNAINYTESSTDNSNCVYEEYSGWQWYWGDEFEKTNLDLSKWAHQLGTGDEFGLTNWGNNEAQFYKEENISFEPCSDNQNNQCLIIEAKRENYEGLEYTSGRIRSKNSGQWLYGKVEIRAKLPTADGTWPAIWMLPNNSPYGGWPDSGEIDIMEHVGCLSNTVYATIHCSDYNHQDGTDGTVQNDINIDTSIFNKYGIEWDENKITWYVNDEYFHTYEQNSQTLNNWPFDQYFYLILNLAIGGDFGTLGGECSIDSNEFTNGQQMEIDYVRVFKKI